MPHKKKNKMYPNDYADYFITLNIFSTDINRRSEDYVHGKIEYNGSSEKWNKTNKKYCIYISTYVMKIYVNTYNKIKNTTQKLHYVKFTSVNSRSKQYFQTVVRPR